MKRILPFLMISALFAGACGSDDGGTGGGHSDADINGKIDEICELANECYQPDAKPGDDTWCYIPTKKDDDGEEGISWDAEYDPGDDPCVAQIKKDHPKEYQAELDCEYRFIQQGIGVLQDECPDTVPELSDDKDPCAQPTLDKAYDDCIASMGGEN